MYHLRPKERARNSSQEVNGEESVPYISLTVLFFFHYCFSFFCQYKNRHHHAILCESHSRNLAWMLSEREFEESRYLISRGCLPLHASFNLVDENLRHLSHSGDLLTLTNTHLPCCLSENLVTLHSRLQQTTN